MIPFADHTITIFNKYVGVEKVGEKELKKNMWLRTIVDGCHCSKNLNTLKNGDFKGGNSGFVCQLPVLDNFKPVDEWAHLDIDTARIYFTLNVGDYIVLQRVNSNLGVDEIVKMFPTQSFGITDIGLNYGDDYPLPHIAVRG